MADFKILGSLSNLAAAKPVQGSQTSGMSGAQSFGDLVGAAVQTVVDTQQTAETMTLAAAQGQNIPMHTVIQAVNEADLALQTLMTVRDRAVEAYQQIQQMPI